MNAQEWLDDLQAKTKAATPGPWYAGYALDMGTVRGNGVVIDCRMTPDDDNFGLKNAAFIAAANPQIVQRLMNMLVFLASLASEDDESVDVIERRIQWAYNETRSKE